MKFRAKVIFYGRRRPHRAEMIRALDCWMWNMQPNFQWAPDVNREWKVKKWAIGK